VEWSGGEGRDLASQPTLSRFENAVSVKSLFRLQDVLIGQFIDSFETPPARLTFDIDVGDDRRGRLVGGNVAPRQVENVGVHWARARSPRDTHGGQQLTMFHGYYDQYQYLPRTITCADNGQVVMVCLLFGTAHAALGAHEDLRLLCERLRQAWPDVQIELRAGSGFAVPAMYEMCEQLGVQYTFGLKMNAV
jgi:hypothetical protein